VILFQVPTDGDDHFDAHSTWMQLAPQVKPLRIKKRIQRFGFCAVNTAPDVSGAFFV